MSEREIVDEEEQPPGIRRVNQELLGGALDLQREVDRLAAMGDPTRFVILYLLAQEGKLRSGELADQLDRRQNNLYHHLDTLEDAGLVGKFKDSTGRVYRLSPLAEMLVPQYFEAVENRANPA